MLWKRDIVDAIFAHYAEELSKTKRRSRGELQIQITKMFLMALKNAFVLPNGIFTVGRREETISFLAKMVDLARSLMPSKYKQIPIGIVPPNLHPYLLFFPEEVLRNNFQKIPKLLYVRDVAKLDQVVHDLTRKPYSEIKLFDFTVIDNQIPQSESGQN